MDVAPKTTATANMRAMEPPMMAFAINVAEAISPESIIHKIGRKKTR